MRVCPEPVEPAEVYQGDGIIYRSCGTYCTEEEGRTRQEEAAATDINRIVARMVQGTLPGVNDVPGRFVDLSQMGDLHESLERVRHAEAAFAALPASVRSAFDNEMAKFTVAFESEEGVAKLRELRVIPETDETLADRREAAKEQRAAARALERERKRRVEEALHPPPAPKAQ